MSFLSLFLTHKPIVFVFVDGERNTCTSTSCSTWELIGSVRRNKIEQNQKAKINFHIKGMEWEKSGFGMLCTICALSVSCYELLFSRFRTFARRPTIKPLIQCSCYRYTYMFRTMSTSMYTLVQCVALHTLEK